MKEIKKKNFALLKKNLKDMMRNVLLSLFDFATYNIIKEVLGEQKKKFTRFV